LLLFFRPKNSEKQQQNSGRFAVFSVAGSRAS